MRTTIMLLILKGRVKFDASTEWVVEGADKNRLLGLTVSIQYLTSDQVDKLRRREENVSQKMEETLWSETLC